MKQGLLRFTVFGLGFVVVSAALAAWLVPPMLDWNRYRFTIAEIVSDNLGRDITIEGPISLSLLPEPILTAGNVSVDSPRGVNDGVTIRVAQLRLRLALIPLLKAQVDARELVLRGLDMHLPWPLGPDPLALRAPTWLSSISARIEDGSLSVGAVTATHIDASLGLVPETGSTSLGGTAVISGQTWHMTSRLTRSGSDGTAGLDLSLDGQGPMQGLGALFSGQIAADGSLSGRITGRGPDLSRLIAAPSVPFKADGRLSIAAGLAVADDLAVEIAGSPARGAVALRLSPNLRLDVSLAASRLDLDAWLPALLRSSNGRIVGGIPIGIDLSSEAATLAGGTLRRLRGSFELGADTVSLRDAAAILPGDAQLNLAGQIHHAGTPDTALIFEGTAALVAPNLRPTLAWMDTSGASTLSSVPSGVLRTADLRASVKLETAARKLSLTDLNGMVDESRVSGSLTLHQAARLGVSGTLALDKLAIDPWWTVDSNGIAGLPARLGRFDLDLQLRADHASLRGQNLAPVSLDFLLETGRLTLRRLEMQASPARLVASGSLLDNGRITDGRLELTSRTDATADIVANWAPQFSALAARMPRGPLSFTVLANGPVEALALRSTLELGDLHVDANPTLDLPGNRWTAAVTLRHPGAPRLFDNFGLGNSAAWLGDGSASWAGTLIATGGIFAPTRIASDAFELAAGGFRGTGSLVLDRTAVPKLTGKITADTLPLPLPSPRSPDPLPVQFLAGWQAVVRVEAAHVLIDQTPVLEQASASISLADAILKFDGIAGKLDAGALAGSIGFDGAAIPPRVNADLSITGMHPPAPLFDLPLDISGGTLDAAVSLAANGHSPAALLATVAGSVHFTARDGEFRGVDLAKVGPGLLDADLRAAMSGGSMAFDRFDVAATIKDGSADITASSMTAPSGTASLLGLLDIAGRNVELRLALHPAVPEPPDLAVRFSGKLDQPSRMLELSDALRWRAQHPQTASVHP